MKPALNLVQLAVLSASLASPLLTQAADKEAINLEAGKKIFVQKAVPACAVCHTLKHANAQGEIGPVLDEIKPDAERVEKAVRNGIGQMPAFSNLSDAEIKLVAKYVASVAGK